MKKQRPVWWGTFWGWTVAMLLVGWGSAELSRYLGAPRYFGGTLGVVLVGMAGLFAVAARVAKR